MRAASFSAMRTPTAVDPVKLIPRTRVSEINLSPHSPEPITRLRTPGGKPAFSSRLTRYTAERGVSDAGFKTRVLPHANAGAIFRTGLTTGKFHGVIDATTPTGRRTVEQEKPGRSLGNVCPDKRTASPAANAASAAARVTSAMDSHSALPCSRVTIRANSFLESTKS